MGTLWKTFAGWWAVGEKGYKPENAFLYVFGAVLATCAIVFVLGAALAGLHWLWFQVF